MEVDGIQTFSRLSLSLSVYILESVDPSRRRLSSLTHSLRLTSSFRFHQLRMDGIIHDNGRFKSGKRQPHYMGRKREKEREREKSLGDKSPPNTTCAGTKIHRLSPDETTCSRRQKNSSQGCAIIQTCRPIDRRINITKRRAAQQLSVKAIDDRCASLAASALLSRQRYIERSSSCLAPGFPNKYWIEEKLSGGEDSRRKHQKRREERL